MLREHECVCQFLQIRKVTYMIDGGRVPGGDKRALGDRWKKEVGICAVVRGIYTWNWFGNGFGEKSRDLY